MQNFLVLINYHEKTSQYNINEAQLNYYLMAALTYQPGKELERASE